MARWQGPGPCDQTAPRWVGLQVVSDSNRQGHDREVRLHAGHSGQRRLRITCHGAFGADEGQARYLLRAQAPLLHFQAESGEGGGLVSCYVTCLRHGHTACLSGSISRTIYAFAVSRALAAMTLLNAGCLLEEQERAGRDPAWPQSASSHCIVAVGSFLGFKWLDARMDSCSAPCR